MLFNLKKLLGQVAIGELFGMDELVLKFTLCLRPFALLEGFSHLLGFPEGSDKKNLQKTRDVLSKSKQNKGHPIKKKLVSLCKNMFFPIDSPTFV